MKVFLRKDIEKVGMAGEIVKVSEGYANNFLFPRKLAVEVTAGNESLFAKRTQILEKREAVIQSKTSMLAERIKSIKVTITRKIHDDGKLYGSISAGEIVDALMEKGISVSKSQVEFGKMLKATGTYDVTIKLTTKLQPTLTVQVVAE